MEAGFVRDLLSRGMNLFICSTNTYWVPSYVLGNVLGTVYRVVNNLGIDPWPGNSIFLRGSQKSKQNKQNPTTLLSNHPASKKVPNQFAGLKLRQASSFQGLSERICFLAFSSFQRLPAFPASWLLPPVSKPCSIFSPLWRQLWSLHFLSLILPPSYKDPCDYIGANCIIQDNLPISRSVTESHLQHPCYHVKEHIYRFQGFVYGPLPVWVVGRDVKGASFSLPQERRMKAKSQSQSFGSNLSRRQW